MTWVSLLKNKSDVSIALMQFYTLIKNQFDTITKGFKFDTVRDYFNQTLTTLFQKERILHESSCVYTLQQNGVAERKNGHLL